MEENVWGKTLLNLYRCLENVTDSIDKIILQMGVSSGRKNSGNFYDSLRQMNRIIELSNNKITLINLKVMIEKSLCSLNEIHKKILILKYFDKNNNQTIIEALNLSRRTYFRKLKEAVKSFSKSLIQFGYTDNYLFNMLKNEEWIMGLYNNYSKKNDDELDSFRIVNLAKKNYKKMKMSFI